MPTYYEGNTIAEIKAQQISSEDFVQGCIFYKKTAGNLKMTYWYAVLFAALAVTAGYIAINEITLYGIITKWLICAAFAFAAVYFAVIRVNKAKKEAESIYKNSKLLVSPVSFRIYRDSFFTENEYEIFNGYWTDMLAGFENKERIILVSEWIPRPIIITKTADNREQTDAISRHLQNTMVSKYKVRI